MNTTVIAYLTKILIIIINNQNALAASQAEFYSTKIHK